MKLKINLLIIGLLAGFAANAQLDEKNRQELEERKQKAKENNTVLWVYDTLYRQGEPYCLFKNKLQSDDGNEYLVQGINGDEIIYVKEPSNIKKTLGIVTGEDYVEFSFLKERQKLNIPRKSINSLPAYIVEQNMVLGNNGNMVAAKKLLFIYSNDNPQGYTSNINTDSLAKADARTGKAEAVAEKPKQDTSKYQPVVRNKKAALDINDYIIRQDGVIIGRYDKTSRTDGGTDNRSVYVFKSPDWKEVATAVNGGLGSVSWEITINGYNKRETLRTSALPKKTLKELVEFLVNNNYL